MAYGQNFDMKEYIRKRMLEITELKDHELFKEAVGGILSAVYEYNRNAFEGLEQRIMEECMPDQSRYLSDRPAAL